MGERRRAVIHQAVVFFDGEALVKEMLHAEFEAVLDQVVGLTDFAEREVRACYLHIDTRLQVLGCVFFLVDFDQRGFVNRSWNLPLQHLLDKAGRGPDLGAGRIRLACRSQCPLAWHQRQLWDPQLEGESGSLQQIVAALHRNRLGLPAELADEQQPEPPVLGVRHGRRGMSGADHELQLAALRASAEEERVQLQRRHDMQVAQLQESMVSLRQLLDDEKRRSQGLNERLDAQVEEFRAAREQLQQALAEAGGLQQTRLQQQFDVEMSARLGQATAELKEMLDMREVELFYREEQLGVLREEIARLRQERESLISRSGNQLLQQLAENGLSFVAYLPGVEVVNVPAGDIPRYLEAPLVYLAEQCQVHLDRYQQWLGHQALPVCGAELEGGMLCGEPVRKIDRPGQFLPGESDRCRHHRTLQALPGGKC